MLINVHLLFPHQTVSLQSFDQSAVCVLVQCETFRDVTQKVQVFESGFGLFSFLLGCPPLVRGALQVELEVHAYGARQNIVHHHDSDVLSPTLDTVEAKKLWQQSPGVLVQVLAGSVCAAVVGKETERHTVYYLVIWRSVCASTSAPYTCRTA